jgi:hypothetical protein
MNYNYLEKKLTTIYKFENEIGRQPDFMVFDLSQSRAIIASTDDVLWVDVMKNKEVDIDDRFQLGDIKSLLYMDKKFYVLANKYQRKLGYFLLELDIRLADAGPEKVRYVIKWENKLEIDDARLYSIQSKTAGESSRDLVVSYKSIHVNSYTVLIINIDSGRIKYRHDNYQLWESPVLGFLNTFSNDFVILNKDGTSFLPLGDNEKRSIYNPDGTYRMVHSLPSCSYLKVADSNLLTFERAK